MATHTFLTTDSVQICYRLDGLPSATPVLLLNGLFGDMPFWDAFVQHFSPDHFCIRMDHRGVGESEPFAGKVEYSRLALDVVELLNHVGVSSVHVVGLCHGGMVGAILSRDYPERVRSMACHGTRLLPSHKIFHYENLRLQVLERQGVAQLFALQAPLIFGEKFLAESAAWLGQMGDKSVYRTTTEAAHALLTACRDFAMSPEEISALRVPALFLAGEEDTYCGPWLTKRSADLWPNAQFHILANSAHIVTREAPEEFHRLVREFLAEQMGTPKFNHGS